MVKPSETNKCLHLDWISKNNLRLWSQTIPRTSWLTLIDSEDFSWDQKLQGPTIISTYNSPLLYVPKYIFCRAGIAGNDI